MQIFHESGYVNIPAIRKAGYPFNIIWGGRAVGKTYGTLKDVVESGVKFMLMRRTQVQMEIISKDDLSPFQPLNRDLGYNIHIKPITKYNYGVYNVQTVDGAETWGSPIGYTCALSTIANMRGFDASDVDVLIYDEFIPEAHARPIKSEGAAFLNAYETINRNRELQGRPPLQVFLLANANALDNPIFVELGIVTKADTMVQKNQALSILKDRGLVLVNVCNSKISEQKRNTALYKLTGDKSEFAQMSLSNQFVGEKERSNIGSKPIIEYTPIVSIGEICIYAHKGGTRHYYVTTFVSGSPPEYGTGDTERARFSRLYNWLWIAYLERRVYFEQRICEILLTKYFS